MSGDYRRALRQLSGTDASTPQKARLQGSILCRTDQGAIVHAARVARVQLAMGAYGEAESTLRGPLSERRPQSPDGRAPAQALLARALFEQGRDEEAEAALREARRHDPQDYLSDLQAAEMLLRRGASPVLALRRLDAARRNLDRVGSGPRLEHRGDTLARLASLRAWALAANADPVVTGQACRSAEERVPKGHRPTLSAVCCDLGRAYRLLGDREQAERCLRTAVAADPDGHAGALARQALHRASRPADP